MPEIWYVKYNITIQIVDGATDMVALVAPADCNLNNNFVLKVTALHFLTVFNLQEQGSIV